MLLSKSDWVSMPFATENNAVAMDFIMA